MWKKRIISSLWWLLGICLIGLFMAGMQYKKHLPCSDIKVNIERVKGHVFIDEKEITQLLTRNGATINKPISGIHLQALENILKQQPWILNAQLFVDNNQVLNVNILEREPLARIFTSAGTSFYIDSSGMQLPLSSDYAARVPMFTGFTATKKKLSKVDSVLMQDIKEIATIIEQDSFWSAQISQVNITSKKTFEIIPVLGNQVIRLGNADSLQSKFDRLAAFYKQVWAKNNFEKYETISVEFSGQIVAVKRGIAKPIIDTVAARRLIRAMQNGEDIVKDTAAVTITVPQVSPVYQYDSSKLKAQSAIVNKQNKSKTIKPNKVELASANSTKKTNKVVAKNRKKAAG